MKTAKNKFDSEKKSKKAISDVITTVLLIMLAVAAVTAIYMFIIPFIKDNLGKSKECFESQGYIKIDTESEYTCFNSTKTKIMVERGESNIGINSIIISLKHGGSSDRYEIINNTATSGVKMYDGTTNLAIPKAGGAETYVFDVGNADYAEIMPELSSGRTCDSTTEKIKAC